MSAALVLVHVGCSRPHDLFNCEFVNSQAVSQPMFKTRHPRHRTGALCVSHSVASCNSCAVGVKHTTRTISGPPCGRGYMLHEAA